MLGVSVLLVCLGVGSPVSGRELTFEQRVRAQEAIERVHYAHQIGSTRPFEDAVPRSVLERQVETYLKQAAALETLWKTPTTADMVEREFRRMTAQSRFPERFDELVQALGEDPVLIRECLVRPALVDRLSRAAFGSDDAIHAEAREEAESLRRELLRLGVDAFSQDPRRTVVELKQIGSEDVAQRATEPRDARAIALEPSAFARWLSRAPGRVGEIGAVRSERDAFVIPVLLQERSGWAQIAYFAVPKRPWDAWWRGVEASFDARSVRTVVDGSAASPFPLGTTRNRPVSSAVSPPFLEQDGWDDGSLDDLPHARSSSARIWTGSLMVVWGGYNGEVVNTGGRYDPATDSWSAMATEGAPAPAEHPRAVWTGSAVAVRTGESDGYPGAASQYDPMTNRWSGAAADAGPGGDRNAEPSVGVADTGVSEPPSSIDVSRRTETPSLVAAADPGDTTPQGTPLDPPPQVDQWPDVSREFSGLLFPTTRPVPSQISIGTQGIDFGHCINGSVPGSICSSDTDCFGGTCELVFDNIFCLSYNMNCASVRTNKREYGFSEALETTYDSSPAPGRQTWIERNWNYSSADGTGWRPFHFAVEVDANSTCVGGTNSGAYCTLLDEDGVCTGGGTCGGKPPTGGARWTFTPNNRNGNTALQLRWPWVAANARLGTDPYWSYGFSSWMRTSDFNPGTTTAGGLFTTYLDHDNDRRGPNQNGVYSIIDFNTTSPGGKVGWIHAGFFDARISGATPNRDISGLTAVRAEVNLASMASSQPIPKTYGVFVQFNPTGTNITDTTHTGVYVASPAAPGTGTTIGTQNGLWIDDQQLVQSLGGGSAILVSAQTTSSGLEGNVRLNGANWNNGHIQLFMGHLWRDATRGVLRYKNINAPGSESDGNAVVTGTASDSHGVVMWGVSTFIDAGFDTGNEVCGASGVGLTCVETAEMQGSAAPIPCDEPHTASKWLAFCK